VETSFCSDFFSSFFIFEPFFPPQAVLEGDLEKAEFLCRFGGDLFALDPRFRNPLQVLYILKGKNHAVVKQ
jgi:hypothetical protein